MTDGDDEVLGGNFKNEERHQQLERRLERSLKKLTSLDRLTRTLSVVLSGGFGLYASQSQVKDANEYLFIWMTLSEPLLAYKGHIPKGGCQQDIT